MQKKQFHNCFFLLGRVVHFEFLRSLSISCLSFSVSPVFPVSPFFPPLFLHATRKPTCRPPCVQRATPSTPNCAAPGIAASRVSALQTTSVSQWTSEAMTCIVISQISWQTRVNKVFFSRVEPAMAPCSHFTSKWTRFYELFVQLFHAIFVSSEPPLDPKNLEKRKVY